MSKPDLPPAVQAVLHESRVCELTTFTRNGTPITTPLAALFEPEYPRFIMTTSIGIPVKALRIRHNPRVALLYSDSTGSGVVDAPAVLVQGEGKAPDEVITSMKGLEKYWRDIIFDRQPAGEANHSNAFMRWLMDWYYMRIVITVRPLRFLWWEHANFSQPAQVLEVSNVA